MKETLFRKVDRHGKKKVAVFMKKKRLFSTRRGEETCVWENTFAFNLEGILGKKVGGSFLCLKKRVFGGGKERAWGDILCLGKRPLIWRLPCQGRGGLFAGGDYANISTARRIFAKLKSAGCDGLSLICEVKGENEQRKATFFSRGVRQT